MVFFIFINYFTINLLDSNLEKNMTTFVKHLKK